MFGEVYDYFTKYGYMERLYELLQRDDHSEVVIAILDIFTKTQMLIKVDKVTKCDSRSTEYREKGNGEYRQHNYREALKWYNKAIVCATENSTALQLGYGNRSALLCTIKAYKACLNDIDMCFKVGRTDQRLADRLTQRKRECERWVWIIDCQRMVEKGTFGGTFFNFDVERNPQIPCASRDVAVNKEKDKLNVVAVRNIEVGTVVSLETAYACELSYDNQYLACFYCHKFDLNLIPCDKCCAVMFCSETCKTRCKTEFHNTECHIMRSLSQSGIRPGTEVQATIKMRQMCSSWTEFIKASKNIGAERMTDSSVNEIYDVNNKFSVLCFDDDLHFLYGRLCNVCFLSAMIIHYLLGVPSFFPERQKQRDKAIQALARVMVNMYLYCTKVFINNSSKNSDTGNISRDTIPNIGMFSFTGKLKHCCDANLLVLGLNNKVALIAIKPIKKGDELTISYIGHYFDSILSRPFALFWHNKRCNCTVCTEGWSTLQYRNKKLNTEEVEAMMSAVVKLNELKPDATVFKNYCFCLAKLQDIQGTLEYHQLYRGFRNFIDLFQTLHTDNCTLTYNRTPK